MFIAREDTPTDRSWLRITGSMSRFKDLTIAIPVNRILFIAEKAGVRTTIYLDDNENTEITTASTVDEILESLENAVP